VKFVEDKKRWLTKLGISSILVFAGVVIGVVGVLFIAVRDQPDPKELEALRLQDTIAYITAEQARLGVDCGALRPAIQNFLVNAIQPVLNVRQPGTDWNTEVSEDVRKQMGELRDFYFACGRLYRAAQNGKWDGLDDLRFAIELDKEIILINTLIRFGEFGEECDASCLDKNFLDLQEAVNRIEVRLARRQ
jgi:hypothetical protein